MRGRETEDKTSWTEQTNKLLEVPRETKCATLLPALETTDAWTSLGVQEISRTGTLRTGEAFQIPDLGSNVSGRRSYLWWSLLSSPPQLRWALVTSWFDSAAGQSSFDGAVKAPQLLVKLLVSFPTAPLRRRDPFAVVSAACRARAKRSSGVAVLAGGALVIAKVGGHRPPGSLCDLSSWRAEPVCVFLL